MAGRSGEPAVPATAKAQSGWRARRLAGDGLTATVPELLAPAGDRLALRAAIENGADAVYFGLDVGFNARARAANLPLDELPDVMAELHRRGVKGYVTLNTLVFPSELEEAERIVRHVAQAPADAVLVQDLGLAAQADVLRTNMRMAFSHAAFMALALAAWIAATAIMSRRHSRLTGLAVIALGLLLAWDIHAVMRRYLHPFDPQAMYRGDEIVDALAADPEPFRVSCPVRGDPVSRHWMDFAFPYRRFENFDPFMPMSVLPVWLRDYVGALGDNPLRIWQLASVRYVAGPAQALRSLTNHPAFLPVAGISVSGNGGMFQAPSQASHILLLNRAALPRAAVFYQWEEVKGGDVWARLADPAWNPWTSVLVEGIPSGGEGERKETAVPVQIAERSWRKIKLAADVRREGILLLNDKFDSSWKAFVDGAAAPILLCNGVMRGVRVPPGRHEIEFRFRSPYRNTAILSYGVLGFLMVWAAGRQAWRKSVKRRPEVG